MTQSFISVSDLSASGWCELAYWELNERVGSRVPVEDSAIDVFSEQTRGAGLCIRTLAQQRTTRTPEAVLRTREQIGLGKCKPMTQGDLRLTERSCFLLRSDAKSRDWWCLALQPLIIASICTFTDALRNGFQNYNRTQGGTWPLSSSIWSSKVSCSRFLQEGLLTFSSQF